jgi:hypothetical protein
MYGKLYEKSGIFVEFSAEIYVVDFGRLLPPEDPTMGKTYHPRSVFSKLLRPEAVMRHPTAVCSDAFTRSIIFPSSFSENFSSNFSDTSG